MTETSHDGTSFAPEPLPASAAAALEEDLAAAGTAWEAPPQFDGEVGRTMFDTPASTDNTVTVLLPREHIHALPSQSTVRIRSHPDGRTYLGVVVAGPFAEPDGLRGDAPVMVTTTVRGAVFLPRYHGRVQVELVGEELSDGTLVPPRFRPLPNSPVFPLDREETARVLGTGGSVRLGVAVGHDDIVVAVPGDAKAVFPRHTAVLGTTGGGKSTTVAGLIVRLQQAGVAVIVLDTEGEYTRIHEPTDDPRMLAALARAGLSPQGVPNMRLFHLVGRDTANPGYPRTFRFSLRFDELSPYTVMDILDLSEAQQQRFLRAYDTCKRLLFDLRQGQMSSDQRARLMEVDEFERGWPGMTLLHLYDVIRAYERRVSGEPAERPLSPDFAPPEAADRLQQAVNRSKESHPTSWRALLGKVGLLRRLKVFDSPDAPPLPYAEMARPGAVSVIDLSDTDSPQVSNLAIAELLRGVHEHQEEAARAAERAGRSPTPVVVFIEEAHEFLSSERAAKMQHLFSQVARIARRGRKRWLGLVFITQLPQHLPDEVFGLVNNYILHKLSDAGVIARLRRSISGIDDSLWLRLPGLAPGQAIVAFTSLSRPLLTAIDPAPCKLRMTE
jgi:DNA helicase HerA-like ATPase